MLRIKKATSEKYFYSLGGRDASRVKLVGLLGIISTLFIIFGYWQFIHISFYIAIAFSPVILVILLYHLSQFGVLLFYPGFDADRHKQKVHDFWQQENYLPKVAVFIPAAGEDVQVVEKTIQDATKIDYPYYKVFVLDDTQDERYRKLAEDTGIYYVRRPNIGEAKKAGNMNYGLTRIKGFDFILVLDADFRPRQEILREMVPYVEDDTGIIQTPQHFSMDKIAHSRSKVEYGAAYIQQDFYRVTQVARNRFKAAICVGTSALYNIDALNRVGGFEGVGKNKGWAHSEDVHTGLKIINSFNRYDKPYTLRYLPVQLTKGTCPDDHHSFYKQQNRWATGSMQMVISNLTLRSTRLNWPQRLIYGGNALYYFYTMSMLVSPLYLLVLATSTNPISWSFTLYFLPSLFFNHVFEPYVMRKPRAPLATSLVVISNAYTFLQALVLVLIRRPLGWEATGSKSAKKSMHFTSFKIIVCLSFILVYILTLAILIMNERFRYGPSIFVIVLFLTSFFTHLVFLFYLLVVNAKSNLLLDRKFYMAITLVILTGFAVFKSYTYHDKYDIVFSDNMFSLQQQRPLPANTETIVDGYRRTVGDLRELFGI